MPLLEKLANYIFTGELFPIILKISKFTPIDKGGEKYKLDNYRIILVFSKTVEILYKNWLTKFIREHTPFDDYQYGFLEQSTYIAAMNFVNDCFQSLT